MSPIEYFDVHWDGPFDPEALENVHGDSVLYMVTGTHGLYGRNVPLYIGKTERSIVSRLAEHSWIWNEPDPVKIYTACVGRFVNWEVNGANAKYPPLDKATIEAVESLLILAHQPAFNTRSKARASLALGVIALFNTGRRSTLYPEVSSMYWAPSVGA